MGDKFEFNPDAKTAEDYEAMWPDTGISEAQKRERVDKVRLKMRKVHNPNPRYIVMPELPWHKGKKKGANNGERETEKE